MWDGVVLLWVGIVVHRRAGCGRHETGTVVGVARVTGEGRDRLA